jgi:predicted neutral ceramidase superfamily lipid hydrolase
MPDERADSEESPAERANRELIELLNELRVAITGVQVLFAFLLTVPFTQRFEDLDATDRRVYYLAVISTAASTLFLIAPTAHHRLRFRSGVKEPLLNVANAFAIVGVALLAIAITLVVYLITDMLYDATAAAVAAACLAGGFVIVWLVVPIAYRPEPTPPPPAEESQDGSPTA